MSPIEVCHMTITLTVPPSYYGRTWLWSLVQRFLINEPLLILLSKGFPMLIHSTYCNNVYMESCVHFWDPIIEALANMLRALTAV